jgi:hypothetical protein
MLPVVRFLVIGAIAMSAAFQTAPLLEVDHVFILTAPMAKEERAAVEAAGLTIGQHVAKHTGAGTASVGVLFSNAYLELLWLDPSVSVDADQMKDVEQMRQPGRMALDGRQPVRRGASSHAHDTRQIALRGGGVPRAMAASGDFNLVSA